ncbi:MAG: DUF4868 domain-containing protein [Campylobacteraceae bacterium]|jgi:hypothetical protein|nr:DUF4868 domain-containing protein [Campylobacteraceae bacterium]
MNANALMEFVDKLLTERPGNNLTIYFSRWVSSKYVSHKPQLSNDIQQEIIAIVLSPLRRLLSDNIVAYNPIGAGDMEIEKLDKADILKIALYLESIADDKIFTDMNTLKIDKIDFYCIEIFFGNQKLYLFRQFHKLKKLRKGILAQIVNNELQTMDGNFLGIDETTDIVLFGDDVYLINHISLERIFKYKDEFLNKTNEALSELLTKNMITNIEQFSEDCCNNIRIMKHFTNIMTKSRLPLFFDNYDKVPSIVMELGLDIDFDNKGKLIYREKSQLFHIINLLSDSYFKTLIAKRTGVSKIEGEL